MTPPPRATDSTQTVVSVLITAHDAARTIGDTLHALGRQVLPPHVRLEVVLVDDRSTDDTGGRACAVGLAGMTLVRRAAHHDPRRTARVAALAAAVRASTGSLLLVLDADAVVPAHWVSRMCRALATAELVAWPLAFRPAGPSREARLVAALQTADNALYLSACRLLSSVGLPAGCCFGAAGVRRDALARCGGFEALAFTLTEDLALARAVHGAGGRLAVGAGECAVVEGAPTLGAFLARAVRVGTGGGSSVLAALLGVGVATLPLAVLLAAVGLAGWPVAVARWLAGCGIIVVGLARARALGAAWVAPLLEPVAIVMALAVWRRARVERAVAWGGLTYARTVPPAGRGVRA